MRAAPERAPSGPRMNEDIRVPEVRLIDQNGQNVGVVATSAAMARAVEAGLDLVEISPDSNPPVAKILDYGKFKYQEQKKAAEARKRQKLGLDAYPYVASSTMLDPRRISLASKVIVTWSKARPEFAGQTLDDIAKALDKLKAELEPAADSKRKRTGKAAAAGSDDKGGSGGDAATARAGRDKDGWPIDMASTGFLKGAAAGNGELAWGFDPDEVAARPEK